MIKIMFSLWFWRFGVSMKNLFILGGALALSSMAASALAGETTEPLVTAAEAQNQVTAAPFSTFQVISSEEQEQAQVTSVSQLSDVQPTDWAFQALQSLVERYGCIAGYPDGTFRGNRAATRYELAAALNACLDQISDRFASKEDLAAVKALQEEFKTELATLKGRVDGLEARTKTLEAQQFSTTTKLVGEAIFQGTQFGSGTDPTPAGFAPGSRGRIGDNFTFNYRATLNFLTSFTGKDLLITGLQQGNYAQAPGVRATNSFESLLGPQLAQANGDDNNVRLFSLQYRFPVLKDKGTVYAIAVGGELSDFTDTLNPYFDSDGQGALSGFGLRNPIYRQINNLEGSIFTGTGLGFNYAFNNKISLSVGYLAVGQDAARSTADASGSGGLFGGDFGAIAQITFKPIENFGVGLTYVRSYTSNPPDVGFGGVTGTFRANIPFGSTTPTSANSAGLEFFWKANPRFALSGWAGATFANAETVGFATLNNGVGAVIPKGADSTVLNFALAAAFPDLFIPGNMGGIIFGMQPRAVSSSVANNTDPDVNFHIEALYRFKVNDNISITPGVIAIINPEGNSSNDPIILGTIRTTFTF
jgi:Carbohydrate-selective porin, OprB family/S-layer homology domain